MLEVRVLCRRLSPKLFYDLNDKIISLNDNDSSVAMNNNKINKNVERQIRDYKRQSLANILEVYELKIEENEVLYQKEFLRLFENDELLRQQQQSDQTQNFMNCLNTYLQQRVDVRLRKIRYKETIIRMELNHTRHRYSKPSASSLMTSRATNVYPEAIIEISETDQQQQQQPFTDKELALLSSAGIHILLYILNLTDFFFCHDIILYLRRTELYKIQSKLSLS